jgi:hypothetical protein
MSDLSDRFALSADASTLIDKHSGKRWSASAALQAMFARDARRMAMDQNELDPRGGGEYNN